jgi:hypothetical protein
MVHSLTFHLTVPLAGRGADPCPETTPFGYRLGSLACVSSGRFRSQSSFRILCLIA